MNSPIIEKIQKQIDEMPWRKRMHLKLRTEMWVIRTMGIWRYLIYIVKWLWS